MRGRKPVKPAVGSVDAPDAPESLSELATVEWHRVLPLLIAGAVVQQVDQSIIAAYCETVVLWRRLTSELIDMEIDDKKPPVYTMWLETSKQLRGLCDQLAFTPAARKQIIASRSTSDPLRDALEGE